MRNANRISDALLALAICVPASCFGEAIAAPSYFYPGAQWDQLASASSVVGLTIINPNSGPGSSSDPNYVSQVTKSKAAGLQVIGYVYTNYAARSLQQVEGDIDLYYSWYNVDGIFIDQVSTSCTIESYYASLNTYVKSKGGKGITVINPGQSTQECYINSADIIVNFEGAYSDYLNWSTTWETKYSPSRFWHIVYAASSITQATNAINLAKSRNAAWIYTTDLTLPNPYGALPTYWTQEVSAVQAISPLGPASITPNSGTGLTETFSALYTDPNGASDLQVGYLDFGNSVFAPHSCIVAYVPASHTLYLFSDTNSGAAGPITAGSNSTLSNSQCTLSGSGGTGTPGGSNLTVPFAITFASGFSGSKNIYGLAQTYSGSQSAWQTLGTWTPAAPLAVSVNPASGGGSGPQTFNALFTDPNGASDLQVVYLDFGTSLFVAHSCIAAYVQASNALYLFSDANTTVSGPITEGGSGTLSNSQCTLAGGGTITSSGNNLTVPFTITFLAGAAASQNVYGLAQSYSGANGGWPLLGGWTTRLAAVSVTPAAEADSGQ